MVEEIDRSGARSSGVPSCCSWSSGGRTRPSLVAAVLRRQNCVYESTRGLQYSQFYCYLASRLRADDRPTQRSPFPPPFTTRPIPPPSAFVEL